MWGAWCYLVYTFPSKYLYQTALPMTVSARMLPPPVKASVGLYPPLVRFSIHRFVVAEGET